MSEHEATAELWDAWVPGEFTNNHQVLQQLLQACAEARVTVLGSHHFNFHPAGLSATVLLAESHVAVHTYPERGLAYVVVCTCGTQAEGAALRVVEALRQCWPGRAVWRVQAARAGD